MKNMNKTESEDKEMTNEEIIEQLENAIGLIKQNGKDWLDNRDIPILEACIKSLTSLDKIRAEILEYIDDLDIATEICAIFDKYKAENELQKSEVEKCHK